MSPTVTTDADKSSGIFGMTFDLRVLLSSLLRGDYLPKLSKVRCDSIKTKMEVKGIVRLGVASASQVLYENTPC